MAALKPVHGVVRVVFRHRANTVPIINVLHVANGYPITNEHTDASLLLLRNLLSPLWGTFWANGVTTGTVWESMQLTDLTSDTSPQLDDVVTSGVGGGGSGAAVPQSAAACVTWKITRKYRGGHPRTYIGPLPTTAITNPTSLNTTYTDALQSRAQTFLAGVNAGVIGGVQQKLVAVHRFRKDDPSADEDGQLPVPLLSVINNAFVDTRIDSQRRRLGPDR